MTNKNLFISGMIVAGLMFFPSPWSLKAYENEALVQRFELTISERKVQLEKNTIRITQGDSVELVWHSDETAELHLHGYDISFEVSAAAPSVVSFEAHATGRFPVTSHSFGGEESHGHQALLYIEVYP
jgi:hypothetical protein